MGEASHCASSGTELRCSSPTSSPSGARCRAAALNASHGGLCPAGNAACCLVEAPDPQRDREGMLSVWQCLWSEEHGRWFFYNRETGETRWRLPKGATRCWQYF